MMVLDPSDYRISNIWRSSWDPTSPKSFLTKAVGTIAAVSFALVLFGVAQNQGQPLVNRVVSRLTGGRVNSGGGIEVF